MKYRSDFVTNSSSSSFICSTSKSKEQVETELKLLLGTYNIMSDCEYKYYEVFDVYDQNGNVVISSGYDNSIPYCLWEIIQDAYGAEREYTG